MTSQPAEWNRYGADELPPVLRAALERFAAQGYHGTPIREIASAAGLSVAGLYHHFPSKQAILVALLDEVLGDLLARVRAAVDAAPDTPPARFDAWVECMLRFHMERAERAFVVSSELRSLEGANRDRVVGLRDELQHLLDDVVAAGAAAGDFATPYPKAASRAVAVMCVGVATWYRADGALSGDELVRRHLALARGIASSAA